MLYLHVVHGLHKRSLVSGFHFLLASGERPPCDQTKDPDVAWRIAISHGDAGFSKPRVQGLRNIYGCVGWLFNVC